MEARVQGFWSYGLQPQFASKVVRLKHHTFIFQACVVLEPLNQTKIVLGRYALTTQFGWSTISEIFRSTATLHKQ